MSEVLLRQWAMLKLVPRAPRKIDTASIERCLRDVGLEIHRRSIQRDLEKLAATWPLVCDRDHKPFGWSWSREAAAFEIPQMDPHTALTYALAEEFLTPLLPRSTLGCLAGRFEQAQKVLGEVGQGVGRWLDKVRVIPRSQPLVPPEVDPQVLEVVYEALFKEQRLSASYRPRGERQRKDYEINPLGLVIRDGVIYLVCTFWNYDQVAHVALNRMASAQALAVPSCRPASFDLDAYINRGHFGFRLDEPIKLKIRVSASGVPAVTETRLSRDQRVTEMDDGSVVVEATVSDTRQLQTWLLGFGELVEVLEPPRLRKVLVDTIQMMARNYKSAHHENQ